MKNTKQSKAIIKMLNDFNSAVNQVALEGKDFVKSIGGFSKLEEIRRLNELVKRRERRVRHE